MVQCERRDDGVAAWQFVLEPTAPELAAAEMLRAPHGGDLEHLGIDVDELDADGGQRVEDRRRESAGAGAEVDHEAAWRDMAVEPVRDRREHPVVAGNEDPDGLVVLVACDAEMTRDSMLFRHRASLRHRQWGASVALWGEVE